MPGPARAGALIYAKDLGLLTHFYRTLLQMDIRSQEAGFVVMENHDIQLLIHAIPESIACDIDIQVPPILREEGAIKLFFTVPSQASPGPRRRLPTSVAACCRSSGRDRVWCCAMRSIRKAISCNCASFSPPPTRCDGLPIKTGPSCCPVALFIRCRRIRYFR